MAAVVPSQVSAETVESAISGVESELKAQVGFYMHNYQSKEGIEHNADARFPLNSTFKLFACAALLSRVDSGQSRLTDSVDLNGVEVVPWSPLVSHSINSGQLSVTLDGLCRMMLSVSDNTAANLVLMEIGGPRGFTEYMRTIGDSVTRLDRWEPSLNEGAPNDPRDTTSPRAIASSLTKVLLGDSLSDSSRKVLKSWLSGHQVADNLFRASLPDSWSIEDRTGAGQHGTRSIVAIIYPPKREPIVATLFMRDTEADISERDMSIARVGAAIVQTASSSN